MSDEIKKLLLPEISYRYLVADHPLQIIEIDLAGTILFVNRPAESPSNQWREGCNLLAPLKDQDRTNLVQAMAKIGQGAATAHCEITLPGHKGGEVRLLAQLGPLSNNNQLNRLLLVFKSLQSARSANPNDIVDPTVIRSHLLSALLCNETIDIKLENMPDSFNTLLLPYPPENREKLSSAYDTDFLPGGYMASMTHLLLCPLEPSFGNIRIRKANEITMTFHEESEAYRGGIQFQGVLQGKEGMALKTSFPKILEPFQRRQTRRVKVPAGMSIKLLISVEHSMTLDTLLGDISPNGLSFYYPPGVTPLAANTEINLTLSVGNGRFLEVYGVVCNTFVARDGENPRATSSLPSVT